MLVTAGASEANACALAGLLEPGEEALVESPGYEPHRAVPPFFGVARAHVRAPPRARLWRRGRGGRGRAHARDAPRRVHRPAQPERRAARGRGRRGPHRARGAPRPVARLRRDLPRRRRSGRRARERALGALGHDLDAHQGLRARRPARRLGLGQRRGAGALRRGPERPLGRARGPVARAGARAGAAPRRAARARARDPRGEPRALAALVADGLPCDASVPSQGTTALSTSRARRRRRVRRVRGRALRAAGGAGALLRRTARRAHRPGRGARPFRRRARHLPERRPRLRRSAPTAEETA